MITKFARLEFEAFYFAIKIWLSTKKNSYFAKNKKGRQFLSPLF